MKLLSTKHLFAVMRKTKSSMQQWMKQVDSSTILLPPPPFSQVSGCGIVKQHIICSLSPKKEPSESLIAVCWYFCKSHSSGICFSSPYAPSWSKLQIPIIPCVFTNNVSQHVDEIPACTFSCQQWEAHCSSLSKFGSCSSSHYQYSQRTRNCQI